LSMYWFSLVLLASLTRKHFLINCLLELIKVSRVPTVTLSVTRHPNRHLTNTNADADILT